jgi:adenylate kinase
VADVMARGELVTDEIVIGLIREKLEGDNWRRLHLRRLPAHAGAGRRAGRTAERYGPEPRCVIEMRVNDDVLVTRIVNRAEEARSAGRPVPAPTTTRKACVSA